MNRLKIASCLVLILAMGIFGCTNGGGSSKDGEGQVLHIGNGAEPQELDPHVVTGVPEHRVTSSLFEGLATLNPETLAPEPAVAESWTISEDGKVYTFTLRNNAKWSNGDPVTAHDFAYAWQRILSPALASEYAYMLYCIASARDYNEGRLQDFAQVGVRVLDEHTLEVSLNNPTPYFLSMQIHYSWYPVHKATIEKFGRMDERNTPWTRPGNLVSNGPFMLERWEPNSMLAVVKNPNYWDAANVRLEGIHFHPIDNLQTEERAFRSGQLQVTESVPLNKIAYYKENDPELLQNDPYLGTYFYRFNVTRPPLNDVRVRRALAMSLDRESIVTNILRGGQQPAANFVPPDTAGYTCTSAIPYDVEAARKLLADAGYPDGKGFPPVELLFNTAETHKTMAEAVQQMWKQNLGIEVQLVNQEWKVYLSSQSNLDYQISRSGWIGDFIDPVNFLECFTTGNGNNRTGYSNPAYDALIAQSKETLGEAERLALFQQAERKVCEDAPFAPIYFYRRLYLKSPEVKGLHPNMLGYIAFKSVYLEPEP